jgi:hypothetical protein
MGRFDFVAEAVEARDSDDALAIAADLHPELPRPRVAVLASPVNPLPFGLRSGQEHIGPQ